MCVCVCVCPCACVYRQELGLTQQWPAQHSIPVGLGVTHSQGDESKQPPELPWDRTPWSPNASALLPCPPLCRVCLLSPPACPEQSPAVMALAWGHALTGCTWLPLAAGPQSTPMLAKGHLGGLLVWAIMNVYH